MNIWVDGTIQGSPPSCTMTTLHTGNTGENCIGAFNNGSGDCSTDGDIVQAWDGRIAHVSLFSRALDAGEREQIRWCPGSITGSRQIYIPLWNATTQEDLSGMGRTGSLHDAVDFADGPPVMNCGGSQ